MESSFIEDFLKKYALYLRSSKIKMRPEVWFLLSFAVAVVLGLLGFIFLTAVNAMPFLLSLSIQVSPLLILILFFVGLDLMVGFPYLKNSQRIDLIEESLPDALKQIADTLKAGATYEFALREVASGNYGPLSEEMAGVLRKLEEGENLENSLKSFSDNVDSKFVKRTVTIIIDSIKAGAGLAEILDEISEDLRELKRIAKERKTKTLMQTIFIVAAGAFVTPIILGFVSTLVSFLISVAAYGLNLAKEELDSVTSARDVIVLLTQAYLAIEIVASSIIISIMRDGKTTKAVIYAPILLLIGYVIFYIAAVFSAIAIGVGVV